MRLFGREEINTSRQFEFDMAKAVCILGMVFVHCFEALSAESADDGPAYYIMVIVLDAIFGAGTFMASMGIGIAYSWKNDADKLIRRGIRIFLLGYLLNIVRDAIPQTILWLVGKAETDDILISLFCTDIMPFAGLALLLFGLLKKAKLSDLWVLIVALAMSAAGSFIRFLDIGHFVANDIAGVIFGTFDPISEDTVAAFPLLNWFIIVVAGYLYGNLLRRCTNKDRYYAIALPVSGIILAVYIAIAIPTRLGMLNGELISYYQMTTPEAVILLVGAVFATSIYYYLGKLFNEKTKAFITRMSANLNSIYCIHWVIIGWTCFFFVLADYDGLGGGAVFAVGVVLFIVANVLAAQWKKYKKNKQAPAKA